MSAKTIRSTRSARTVPTASRVPTTTSAQSEAITRSGFTLVEILIVVAIISMVMAFAMPAIQQVTLQRVYSTSRQFIGMIRTIRNDSVLLNQVHRLAFDFDKNVWWVDQQREFRLLETQESLSKKERGRKRSEEPPPSNFTLAAKYTKQPASFPDGVSFDGVLKEREGLRREGIVFIHFFPNGYNEPAIIYVNRAGNEITESNSLVVRATTGTVEFFRHYVRDFEGAQP